MKGLSILLLILTQLQFCNPADESGPIAKNVKIEFHLAEDENVEGFVEKELNGAKIYLNPKVEITEKDIHLAQKSYTDYGSNIILLEMNEQGARKFESLTANNIMKKIAILVNGKVLIAPVVNAKIPGGKVSISGDFTKQDIDELFNTLTVNPK